MIGLIPLSQQEKDAYQFYRLSLAVVDDSCPEERLHKTAYRLLKTTEAHAQMQVMVWPLRPLAVVALKVTLLFAAPRVLRVSCRRTQENVKILEVFARRIRGMCFEYVENRHCHQGAGVLSRAKHCAQRCCPDARIAPKKVLVF